MNLSNELTKQVKGHLDEVRKHLGALPADERQEILQTIESHIHDALGTRSDGEPTPALLDAVIAEMDPPESYGEPRLTPEKKKKRIPLFLIMGLALPAIIMIVMWPRVEKKPSSVNRPTPESTQHIALSLEAQIAQFRVHSLIERIIAFKKAKGVLPEDSADLIELEHNPSKFNIENFQRLEFGKSDTYQLVVYFETASDNTVICKGTVKCNPEEDPVAEYDFPAAGNLPGPRLPQLLTELTSDLIGHWQSVDFAESIEQFNPNQKTSSRDLYLKELTFLPDGKTDRPYWTWKDGILHHSGDNTDAKFFIKKISGVEYLFLEWMSGDVINKGLSPKYYVLKKESEPDN